MNINEITIFCGKGRKSDKLRLQSIDKQINGPIVCKINLGNNQYENIKLFLDSETDLINFKNSVISAVDNYKRGNK